MLFFWKREVYGRYTISLQTKIPIQSEMLDVQVGAE
jgi:hypothetical protein